MYIVEDFSLMMHLQSPSDACFRVQLCSDHSVTMAGCSCLCPIHPVDQAADLLDLYL